LNISAVHSNGPLSDGRPRARATGVARPGLIDAIEAIEDFLGMFRRDPGAAIDNFEANVSLGS
jgi:hypothetical protein